MQNPALPPRTYADLGPSIFADVIAPAFRAEVEDLSAWRHRWRKAANFFEALAIAVGVLSTVLAFAAGFFRVPLLSFVAGLLMAVSTGLLTYSKFGNHESSERTASLNRLLLQVGITPEPDLIVDDSPPAPALTSAPAPTSAPTPAPAPADAEGKQGDALLAALAVTPVETRAPIDAGTSAAVSAQ